MFGSLTEVAKKKTYVRVSFETVTIYIHPEYVDYRWLGPDGIEKAKAHAVQTGGKLLSWQDDRRQTVVRVTGAVRMSV